MNTRWMTIVNATRNLQLLFLALGLALAPLNMAQAAGDFVGETLNYRISKFGLKVAQASITYQGKVEVDGEELILVDFVATGLKFLDEEKIYLDPKTFFPVQIERNLNIFGSEERIVEHYEPAKGIVRIVKTVNGEEIGRAHV